MSTDDKSAPHVPTMCRCADCGEVYNVSPEGWDPVVTFDPHDGHCPHATARADAMRAGLIEALTPEMGPRMARVAVLGPEPDLSPEDAVVYDTVQHPMSVRHVSLNHDGTFTMAYEEGAMDPKPKEQHPPPWRWERQGRTSLLMDADNHCVLALDDDERGQQQESLRTPMEVIRAAPEMEKRLRQVALMLRQHLESECTTGQGLALRLTSSHSPLVLAEEILARIDAAAKGG